MIKKEPKVGSLWRYARDDSTLSLLKYRGLYNSFYTFDYFNPYKCRWEENKALVHEFNGHQVEPSTKKHKRAYMQWVWEVV
jgi:hypothetical protein